MKKVTQFLLALLFAALPVTGFAAAADVLFSQKNSSNTAWANVIVAPTPSSALAFNSSKVPISTQALTLLSVTSPAGNGLTLGTTDSGAAITVATTNKVGIGTTTPGLYDGESNDLVVFRAATAGITIAVSDTTSRAAIRFADGTTGSEAYRGGIEYDHGTGSGGTADSLHFRTAAALRMSINGAGNVGIGTTTPYSTLTVGIDDATAVITPGGNNTHLTFKSVGENGALRFFATGGTTASVATTESMRVDAGGNVGIGTNAPSSKLNITGTNALPLTSGTAASGAIRIDGGTDLIMDMGTSASFGGWVQVRNKTNYANNYAIAINPNGGEVLLGTTDGTGLTGGSGLKIASTTAASANAGALVVAGGISAGNTGSAASYFGGAVTAMIAGTRTGINDDSVATFTPLVIGGASRGFFVILSSDYSQSIIGGYFSSGTDYLLYTIVKSADVTTTNTTTMTGTTGTDGKMNIGFNNGIIYIENRLGGSGNFLYLPFGGTN